MKKLIIDRTKWARGRTYNCLHHSITKTQCCLGFWALDNGFSLEEITDKVSPRGLNSERCDALGLTEKLQHLLIEYNDQFLEGLPVISPTEFEINREAVLKELFKEMDVEVEFVN